MDFYKIREIESEDRKTKIPTLEIYPDFKICRSQDLMVRGKAFYAIWDDSAGMWSTDEYDVQRLVDQDLYEYYKVAKSRFDGEIKVKYLGNFGSGMWLKFQQYIKSVSDSAVQLDEVLTFRDDIVNKTDYRSKRLPYILDTQPPRAYDELVSVLYSPEEREKLEWCIGAIVAGESRNLQKFAVLYGSAGTGKSTVLNIIQKIFEGYYSVFEAKALTSSTNAFATEAFRSNPLVALQHDGDLSRIEDNTKLNSIVSHEEMVINEKHKSTYSSRINSFLFMGSNKAVKITDSKSGVIRRLIDIHPSGKTVSPKAYHRLVKQIEFETGSIASHCRDVYLKLGRDYYATYRPVQMILATDTFYNFIEMNFDYFSEVEGVSLKTAYLMYKEYCNEGLVPYPLPQYKFREELKTYFRGFEERHDISGERIRSWYYDFVGDEFSNVVRTSSSGGLELSERKSILDDVLSRCKAQYANVHETPSSKWDLCETRLGELDTTRLHYVQPPQNHIVIDFDLRDEVGNKDSKRNIQAARNWPATYAEFSKSGGGIHLHYTYEGDVTELASLYSEGIEIKTFVGNSSLRRRLSYCNNLPVATFTGSLPKKEKRAVITDAKLSSEKSLRDLIERNLRKEIHPATKPSVDFIKKILDDAYLTDMSYDVSDMKNKILMFAYGSTNQSAAAAAQVRKMKFTSKDHESSSEVGVIADSDAPIVIFDLEVYPNLFVVSGAYADQDGPASFNMINPGPDEVSQFVKSYRLVGFNNRKYDNHILFAAMLGYTNEQLFKLSQDIIEKKRGFFSNAYNLSYSDIYDFSAKKQGLKKWQIELGLRHLEWSYPWDQPVPEDLIMKVLEYCGNDVATTRALWNHLKGDFSARLILAKLSGLSANDTTNAHTTKIIFGDNRRPQSDFYYTDLATGERYAYPDAPKWHRDGNGRTSGSKDRNSFPGYTYSYGKSEYRGIITGEGGFVDEKPGMYENVVLLDVASMHPTSIEELELFGPVYTKKFSELKQARVFIKHGDYDSVKKMFDGRVAEYLEDSSLAVALSTALKIAINSVYGLTAASFEHPFRDPRNVDNIVAKRGALFMVDLKFFIEEQGYECVHIKTDSVKIANGDDKIIEEVMAFGAKYGYEFEHEATYEKLCLINKADYVAKTIPGRKPAYWTATGARFSHPYVFKTLFSKEPIKFEDLCETKSVTTAIYLSDVVPGGKLAANANADDAKLRDSVKPIFVGKAGSFVPVKPETGGKTLVREKDGEYHAVAGTKGRVWKESSVMAELPDRFNEVDLGYFDGLVSDAKALLSKYGDAERFLD